MEEAPAGMQENAEVKGRELLEGTSECVLLEGRDEED